jgi:hypothetical protein
MAAALSEAELIERIEALRIPPSPSGAPHDWKDWYHFVLLDARTGWRAIANVNLCGGGDDAQVQFTLIVHEPGAPARVHGCSRAVAWRPGMVQARPLAVRTDEVGLGFGNGVFTLRVAPRGAELALELQARPDATPLLVTEGSPFGSGFIGWGLMPRLAVSGSLAVCGRTVAIDPGWFCYQDHNFGRFHWGEDFGWEWIVAHVQPDAGEPITVVVDLRTDRAHRRGGLPYLFVLAGRSLRKVFLGPALALHWEWADAASLPPRLPGAMATLLADRTVRRPREITLAAADERDRISLTIAVTDYLEVVAPDNIGAACTRIGETSGPAGIALHLGDVERRGRGLAYAEYTR